MKKNQEYPCFNLVRVTKLKGDVKLRVEEEKMKVPFSTKNGNNTEEH